MIRTASPASRTISVKHSVSNGLKDIPTHFSPIMFATTSPVPCGISLFALIFRTYPSSPYRYELASSSVDVDSRYSVTCTPVITTSSKFGVKPLVEFITALFASVISVSYHFIVNLPYLSHLAYWHPIWHVHAITCLKVSASSSGLAGIW